MGRFLLQFRRNQNWLLVRELKLSIVSGVTQCPQHPLKNPKGFGDVALQHWPNCDTYNLDTRIQHCRSLLIWALLRNNSFLEVNCSFFFPVDFFSIYELQYKVIMKMFLKEKKNKQERSVVRYSSWKPCCWKNDLHWDFWGRKDPLSQLALS